MYTILEAQDKPAIFPEHFQKSETNLKVAGLNLKKNTGSKGGIALYQLIEATHGVLERSCHPPRNISLILPSDFRDTSNSGVTSRFHEDKRLKAPAWSLKTRI